jgi:hypothetical protein
LHHGDLVLLQPGIVALAERATEWAVRAEAAALFARGPLSHLSALAATGLVPQPAGPVHVTVAPDRCPRGGTAMVAHRSTRRQTTIRAGRLEVIAPERSIVDAWAWALAPARNHLAAVERPIVRRALIDGVRSREFRVSAVRRESARLGAHPGRRALMALLELLAGGCESELEIWGVLNLLPGPPQLPAYVQQHRVQLADGRRVRLDVAYVEARVAVELDGAAFHGSRSARERDIRRDSALAAEGWVVLRFSYARLLADPEGCGREIVEVVLRRLAAR